MGGGGASVTKPFVQTNDAELKAIYVDPDCWGRGTGTALLEQGLETLPERITRLRLEVLFDNDIGTHFYEVRGFEKNGHQQRRTRRRVVSDLYLHAGTLSRSKRAGSLRAETDNGSATATPRCNSYIDM
ncbi:GNAT family N-acetyltransferase [Natrinema gari]|uniref:N-acetyltransferase GCN5 n=1 Tax=Natrinema gari JCM 14663 TaxID=1230459 RepID=L9Z432_9EURY|nr:GNAT family N-acetyltransferase [Natrinema gari]ELY81270.1 N-acetyltransferase GCN5 [Natrinema gari JCM 14663]